MVVRKVRGGGGLDKNGSSGGGLKKKKWLDSRYIFEGAASRTSL